MIRVVTLEESDAGRYQAFCESRSDYLIYYSWKYRTLLLRLLRCRALYLAAVKGDGDLLAVMPVMAKDGVYGTVMNSLPFFGSHGGILGDDPGAREALLGAYRELLSKPGVAASTVIVNPFHAGDVRYPGDLTDERLSGFTSLQGAETPQGIFARIAASARNDVRRSLRHGVSVRIENDALETLCRMHKERMSVLSGKPKPDEFFRVLPEVLEPGRDFDLYVARLDGQVAAMLLLLYGGRVVEYFIPVVEPALRHTQASAALLFRAMQDAASRGYALWNWGGTWHSQEGVLRFKRNWGAEVGHYLYFTKVLDPSLYARSAGELLAAYDGFYVMPFRALSDRGRSELKT